MSHSIIKLCSTALVIMLMVSCKSSAPIPEEEIGVKFEKSKLLSDVLDKALDQNKLVFVDIYTDWCLPCKMMDQDVFSDEGIADLMNENFINYKINAEKGNGPDLSFLYQVQVYPTLLFLDAKGNVVIRKNGAAFHTELRRLVDEALLTVGE